MQTRSKSGVIELRHFFSFSAYLAEIEHADFTQVSKHSKYKKAMADEYNILITNELRIGSTLA